jgi:hypothetical protein
MKRVALSLRAQHNLNTSKDTKTQIQTKTGSLLTLLSSRFWSCCITKERQQNVRSSRLAHDSSTTAVGLILTLSRMCIAFIMHAHVSIMPAYVLGAPGLGVHENIRQVLEMVMF